LYYVEKRSLRLALDRSTSAKSMLSCTVFFLSPRYPYPLSRNFAFSSPWNRSFIFALLWTFAVDVVTVWMRPLSASTKLPDFPLRRFVVYRHCNQLLTGSYARSRHGKRYPYYHHGNKKCTRSKSIQKALFEQKFVQILETIEPDTKYEKLFKAVVLDA